MIDRNLFGDFLDCMAAGRFDDVTPETASRAILGAVLVIVTNGGSTEDVLNLCRAHAALTGRAPTFRPGDVTVQGDPAAVAQALLDAAKRMAETPRAEEC